MTTLELRQVILRRDASLAKRLEALSDTDPLTGGTLDSLSLIHLIDCLEKELGIDIPPQALTRENFANLEAVTRLLQTVLPKAA